MATRDVAVKEMERTGQVDRQQVGALLVKLDEYRDLHLEAETLGAELELARALKSQDPEDWANMPVPVAQTLLAGLILWCQGEGREALEAPSQGTPRALLVLVGRKVHIVDLLRWVLLGVLTDEQRDLGRALRR